jgi:hypothetical protein
VLGENNEGNGILRVISNVSPNRNMAYLETKYKEIDKAMNTKSKIAITFLSF